MFPCDKVWVAWKFWQTKKKFWPESFVTSKFFVTNVLYTQEIQNKH